MKQARNSVDRFIDDLGGTSKVANALELPASTVSTWRTIGRIPRWHHKSIAEIAALAGREWPTDATK